MDAALAQMIHDGAGEQALERRARERLPGLQADGVRKVLAGETTVEEILRVTRSG